MRTECFAVRKFVCLAVLVTILSFLSLTSGSLFGQETGGAIGGTLKDASGAVVVGARVTITNKSTGRIFAATTGSNGTYTVRQLEPGRYSVRFDMSGFAPVEVADAELLLGKTVKVDASLQVAPVEQAVTVIETVPLVDLSSTTVGHNVTSEEFGGLPKARSFQGLFRASPSVTSGVDQFGNIVGIEGGFQVNGASSAENQYNIDGVSTTSLINGRSRQNAVSEFIQEVQVKTGGIEAEYGGAMGGVLSAVTKSGGNAFHGDVHYYLGGNKLSAVPIQRLLLDPVGERNVSFVQDDKQGDDRHEFGGSIGGYFIKNKLWFFAGISPQWRRRSNDYQFSSGAEQGTLKVKRLDQNVFGKVSFDPFTRMRTNFTYLWTPTFSTGRPPAYNSGPNQTTSSKASNEITKQIGFFQPQTSYTGTIDLLLGNKMILTVKAGRFWDNYKDTGIPGISAVEYRTSTSSLTPALLATVPANQQGPILFGNTPRFRQVFKDIVARTYIQADYGIFGNLWGDHDLKLGIGTMKNVNDVNDGYPGGGYVLVFWGSTFQGPAGSFCSSQANRDAGLCGGTYGYYESNDIATRGTSGANISNIYVQDRWRIHPRLTLNLGLRFEKETVPSFQRNVKDFAFKFDYGDKIAPRLGFAYDYFGDGKLKLSMSWGRFYDWVKYELVRGTFGGDIWRINYRSLDTPNAFSLGNGNLPGKDIWNPAVPNSFRNRRVPGFDFVAPGIKPMSTDLLNVGAEYQLSSNVVVSAYYVHNSLNRTIEDLGALDASGDEVYYYANPGEGVAKITPASGATTQVIPTPKPVRTYNAMELSISRRMTNGWFGSASYVFSRLYGNYSGTAASEELRPPTSGVSAATAQQQGGSLTRQGGNANRAWDLDEILFDSHGKLDVLGRLPTDRPHQLKLYGSKEFNWGTELGLFFSVASGTPATTYVNTVNQTEAFVEGRGDMGRTPILSSTDLMVGHSFDLREGKKLRVEFNMINLFNQKTSRHLFQWLNRGVEGARASSAINLSTTDLYKGYDYKALIANSTDGRNANLGALDPRYGKDDIWNPGFQGRLGIKFTF